tara:strand:+ start:4120 stop:4344 length:225 start_codon:yes stop_codon:yes gene_type:complete
MAKTTKKVKPKKTLKQKSTLRKRARRANGTFIADDPGTPDVNEAYVQPPVSNNKKYLGILIGMVLLALLLLSQG